jgi:hypothetical protein
MKMHVDRSHTDWELSPPLTAAMIEAAITIVEAKRTGFLTSSMREL